MYSRARLIRVLVNKNLTSKEDKERLHCTSNYNSLNNLTSLHESLMLYGDERMRDFKSFANNIDNM